MVEQFLNELEALTELENCETQVPSAESLVGAAFICSPSVAAALTLVNTVPWCAFEGSKTASLLSQVCRALVSADCRAHCGTLKLYWAISCIQDPSDTVPTCLLCSLPHSGYSQEVVCYTLGNIPQMPLAPRLVRAGVTWITLQWSRPEGCSPEEVITYTLDIQEDENVSPTVCTPAEHPGLTNYLNSRPLSISIRAIIPGLPKLSK